MSKFTWSTEGWNVFSLCYCRVPRDSCRDQGCTEHCSQPRGSCLSSLEQEIFCIRNFAKERERITHAGVWVMLGSWCSKSLLPTPGQRPPSWMELVLCSPSPAWTVRSRQRDIDHLTINPFWWEAPGLEPWCLSCIYCICFLFQTERTASVNISVFMWIFFPTSSANLLWFSHAHQSWSWRLFQPKQFCDSGVS